MLFLLFILVGITSCAMWLKICAVTVRTKNYKSIIKKEQKMNDKIVLLVKSKVNTMEVLISKALIDPNISHDEILLLNHMLKEYDNMTEVSIIERLKQLIKDFSLFIKQCCRFVWSVEKIQKIQTEKL